MLPSVLQFASSEQADQVYMACGKIAISWGPVEQAMESLIILLRSRQRAPHDIQFPASFSKKSDELKVRTKVVPQDDIRPKMSNLLARAKELHNFRNIIVHGHCQGTMLDGKILFHVSALKEGVSCRPKTILLDDINSSVDSMAEIAAALSGLFNEIRVIYDT